MGPAAARGAGAQTPAPACAPFSAAHEPRASLVASLPQSTVGRAKGRAWAKRGRQGAGVGGPRRSALPEPVRVRRSPKSIDSCNSFGGGQVGGWSRGALPAAAGAPLAGMPQRRCRGRAASRWHPPRHAHPSTTCRGGAAGSCRGAREVQCGDRWRRRRARPAPFSRTLTGGRGAAKAEQGDDADGGAHGGGGGRGGAGRVVSGEPALAARARGTSFCSRARAHAPPAECARSVDPPATRRIAPVIHGAHGRGRACARRRGGAEGRLSNGLHRRPHGTTLPLDWWRL